MEFDQATTYNFHRAGLNSRHKPQRTVQSFSKLRLGVDTIKWRYMTTANAISHPPSASLSPRLSSPYADTVPMLGSSRGGGTSSTVLRPKPNPQVASGLGAGRLTLPADTANPVLTANWSPKPNPQVAAAMRAGRHTLPASPQAVAALRARPHAAVGNLSDYQLYRSTDDLTAKIGSVPFNGPTTTVMDRPPMQPRHCTPRRVQHACPLLYTFDPPPWALE